MPQKFSLKTPHQEAIIVDYDRPRSKVRLDGLQVEKLFPTIKAASNIWEKSGMYTSGETKVSFDVKGSLYSVVVRVSFQNVRKQKAADVLNRKPLDPICPWDTVTYPEYMEIDASHPYNSTHSGTMYVKASIPKVFEPGREVRDLEPRFYIELKLLTGATQSAWTLTRDFPKDAWDTTIKYLKVPTLMRRGVALEVVDGLPR